MSKKTPRANKNKNGRQIILDVVETLPETAGVYRMLGIGPRGDEKILYIGKAKNLKRRVTSYTRSERLPLRLQRMVAETQHMEIIHTHTEAEALLLEANMIRQLEPKYNILLRDDKAVPYIHITGDHDYPRLTTYRGKRLPSVDRRHGDYYGPFISSRVVYPTVTALHKAFQLRNCSDNIFANRSRPCLQYHIKRCTAPCVGKVNKQEYATQVKQAQDFLSGKSKRVQSELVKSMQAASDAQDYERAAMLRDRIKALTAVQAQQDINLEGEIEDADILALHLAEGLACLQVFFIRHGRTYGNRAYFPKHTADMTEAEIMTGFIGQFYARFTPPKTVLVSHMPEDPSTLADLLTVRVKEAGGRHSISFHAPHRGTKRRILDLALDNARKEHARRRADFAHTAKMLDGVAKAFDLREMPNRIEVYDNSHISGTNPIGAMIVATPDGFDRRSYRKFTIKDTNAAGDDFAMMREVLMRRFGHSEADGSRDSCHPDTATKQKTWPDPDLLLIDGGKGQLSAVLDVLRELGRDDLHVVAIAKGPDRNAGHETFFTSADPKREQSFDHRDPVLYYLQQLRDEAHRFAIGTHRAKRQKTLSKSRLDDVPGIGATRKKRLIQHFGSAQGVIDAGVRDLGAVEGISQKLAQEIYDYFRG